MKKTCSALLLSLFLLLGAAGSALAVPVAGDTVGGVLIGDSVAIDFYNLIDSRPLDFQGRDNVTYNGSTATGTVSNTFHFTNGDGTLNDGTTDADPEAQQVFDTSVSSQSIELWFDALYTIDAIVFYGGDPVLSYVDPIGIFLLDTYTGKLASLSVAAGSNEESYSTVADSMYTTFDGSQTTYADDYVILSEAIRNTPVQSLVLGDFGTESGTYFSFTEIKVYGSLWVDPTQDQGTPAVPEPSSLLLLGLGLAALLAGGAKRFSDTV